MATTYPVLRWQIGDVRISRVVEIEGSSRGTFFFKDATPVEAYAKTTAI